MKKLILLITIMLIIFTAISCNSANAPSVGGIRLAINDGISRGIEPNISLDVAGYIVNGYGPNNQEFNVNISSSSYTKTDLLPGEWIIKAGAVNLKNQIIGSDTVTVTVKPGQTTEARLMITEEVGEGTINISLSAPSAGYTAVISKVSGESLTECKQANMVVQKNGSYTASFSLMNGYYTLSFTSDNSAVSLPAPVTFRIVKGDTLNASFMAETANIVSFYSGNRLIETRECPPGSTQSFPSIELGNGFTLEGWKAEGSDVLIKDESFSLPYSEKEYKYYAYIDTELLTIVDTGAVYGTYYLENNSRITEIFIPDSIRGKEVTSIGYRAFTSLLRPTAISIPDSVTSIEEYAFGGCSKLASITIPDSVTSIGPHAFHGCSSLASITIPDSVTSIEECVFDKCSNLTDITIGDSVTSIGDWAFYDCSSLTSIIIPDSVTSIGELAFMYCTRLTSITIPDSVISIGDSAFNNCFRLERINIPNSVTSIGDGAFSDCSSLTDITIGDSVTSIGDGAFGGCTSLTSINIPDSVISIGKYAFSDCSSLSNITIGKGVTSIKYGAFSDCSSLSEIRINKPKDSVPGAPWGAPSYPEVNWQGEF